MASKDTYSGSIRVFDEKDTCTVYWSHRFCFFGYMFNCWNKFLADVGLLNANWAEPNRWVPTLPRIWSLCPTPMRINLTWMETKKSPKEMFQEIEKNYAKILITYNQMTIGILLLSIPTMLICVFRSQFTFLHISLIGEVGYTNYYINAWSVVTKKSKFDLRSRIQRWNFTDISIMTYKRAPRRIFR